MSFLPKKKNKIPLEPKLFNWMNTTEYTGGENEKILSLEKAGMYQDEINFFRAYLEFLKNPEI